MILMAMIKALGVFEFFVAVSFTKPRRGEKFGRFHVIGTKRGE
jgi:hypothetical protein